MASTGGISVLIAHPDPQMVRFISTALEFERDIRVVGTTSTADETLKKVAELTPQVVLIASELPDMETPRAIFSIASKTYRTGVVLISSNESLDFLRRCMQSGARLYLVIPFPSDRLVTGIRDVAARVERDIQTRQKLQTPQATGPLRAPTQLMQEPQGPRTIAFFGAKGGVGKTTCAVNVAVGLRQRTGRRVALVDGDFSFGDMHLLLNIRPEHTILDYVEHIRDADAEYVRGLLQRHETGVRVLPSPMQPEHAELVRAEHLKPLIDQLARNFDYIVIDCALSYDERSLTLLDASDTIFLITTPEVGPLHNAVRFLNLAQALNYPRDKVQVVLNRFDSEVGITAEDVQQSLGQPVMFKLPSRGRQMALAANMGQPFILQNAGTDMGKGLFQMVDFIQGKLPVGAG